MNIIHWACYKNWKVKWEAHTGVVRQWSTSIFGNSCCRMYCPGHAEVKEMTEQTDWREKQPSQMVCVAEDVMCWGAWDTTCGHKAKDITPSIAWRRDACQEEALYNIPWERAIVSHVNISRVKIQDYVIISSEKLKHDWT